MECNTLVVGSWCKWLKTYANQNILYSFEKYNSRTLFLSLLLLVTVLFPRPLIHITSQLRKYIFLEGLRLLFHFLSGILAPYAPRNTILLKMCLQVWMTWKDVDSGRDRVCKTKVENHKLVVRKIQNVFFSWVLLFVTI